MVHDLSTLEDFNVTLSLYLSRCRASYKIVKKLINPNSHTGYLKDFYIRSYQNMQCATLASVYNSNYQWKLSSLKADEFVIKSYHHRIIKKIKIFLYRKVYLGVRGTWNVRQALKVHRICKEQKKLTYLCKLAVLYKFTISVLQVYNFTVLQVQIKFFLENLNIRYKSYWGPSFWKINNSLFVKILCNK